MNQDEVMQDIINHVKQGAADVIKENDRLRKELETERELTHRFAAEAGITKMRLMDAERTIERLRREIAERDTAVLLEDTAVVAELEAHGIDRAGVGQ